MIFSENRIPLLFRIMLKAPRIDAIIPAVGGGSQLDAAFGERHNKSQPAAML
jgi:hypothetical protein